MKRKYNENMLKKAGYKIELLSRIIDRRSNKFVKALVSNKTELSKLNFTEALIDQAFSRTNPISAIDDVLAQLPLLQKEFPFITAEMFAKAVTYHDITEVTQLLIKNKESFKTLPKATLIEILEKGCRNTLKWLNDALNDIHAHAATVEPPTLTPIISAATSPVSTEIVSSPTQLNAIEPELIAEGWHGANLTADIDEEGMEISREEYADAYADADEELMEVTDSDITNSPSTVQSGTTRPVAFAFRPWSTEQVPIESEAEELPDLFPQGPF